MTEKSFPSPYDQAPAAGAEGWKDLYAYNLVFHTAPHHYNGAYHWHVHLFPKLVTTAGFERGTGVMINIVPPEQAAVQLRHVSVRA